MARPLTPQDAYSIINLINKELSGQNATVQAVDSSSFVSAGETAISYGTENVFNALGIVAIHTIFKVLSYEGKFNIVDYTGSGLFATRMRKVSFYSLEAEASGYFNTNLKTNLADGYDNGTNGGQSMPTMWEQKQGIPLELNFCGQDVWDDHLTVYEKQLNVAVANEGELVSFFGGILTEKKNDIAQQMEAFRRMAVLNYIAGVYDMNNAGSVKNMTALFNAKFGTSYTTAQLQTTYLKEFLAFFVATVKLDSNRLENRSLKAHWSPAKQVGGNNYVLLRHTPKAKQKMFLYTPFMVDAEAMVLPEIFNANYLKMENYEAVDFWQNENEPSKIDVTPAIPDVSDPTSQKQGDRVQLNTVLGLIFDEDAIMVSNQLEETMTTPVEARKGYRNIWWHFSKNVINDFTENAILYYMAD